MTYKITSETRQKMSESARHRDEKKRGALQPHGTNHHSWSDFPSVLALHKRIHRTIGKASNFNCVDCGKKALDWSCNHVKYTDDIKDYSPRCRSCHVKKDKNWIKRK